MLQQPLADLEITPGYVVEWALERSGDQSGSEQLTSYNQRKHYEVAESGPRSDQSVESWIAVTFELPGSLDRAAFAAALRAFATRHEILRCDFDRAEADADLTCAVIDADDVITTPREVGLIEDAAALREYIFSFFCARIDTKSWPLIAVGTVEGPRSTTVFVACDHLVSDGGSVPIVARDLSTAYEAELRGDGVALQEAGSYVDFSEQQRRVYDTVAADDPRLARWRTFMSRNGGFFPRFPLDLGIDDDLVMYPTVNRTDELAGKDAADRLAAYCADRKVRIPAALLAATGVALRELGGPDSYRTLMPVGERGRDEFADSMGWFVNTMPIEFSVAAHIDFDDIVVRANDALTEMLASVDVPFVKAWYALAPELAELPAWPYAVNFFSYMDFRKAVGGDDPIVSRARMHVWSSSSNGICNWFHRNGDGLFVNTIRVDTQRAHATERALIDRVTKILAGLIDGARPSPEPMLVS